MYSTFLRFIEYIKYTTTVRMPDIIIICAYLDTRYLAMKRNHHNR